MVPFLNSYKQVCRHLHRNGQGRSKNQITAEIMKQLREANLGQEVIEALKIKYGNITTIDLTELTNALRQKAERDESNATASSAGYAGAAAKEAGPPPAGARPLKFPNTVAYCFSHGAVWSFGNEAAERPHPPHTTATCTTCDHTESQIKVTPFNRTSDKVDGKVTSARGCPIIKK